MISTNALGAFALSGTYMYDDAHVTSVCSPASALFPADNILDARPNRPARFLPGGLATSFSFGWMVPDEFWHGGGENHFDPSVLVIGGCRDRGYGFQTGITWEMRTFNLYINVNDTETGTYTQLQSHIIDPRQQLNGHYIGSTDYMFDLSGIALATRQKRFWKVTITVSTGNLGGGWDIGCVMLGSKYTFPRGTRNVVTRFADMNVQMGRTPGGPVIYRSYKPRRVLGFESRGMSDAERDELVSLARGSGQGIMSSRTTMWHRLNHITAINPGTEWRNQGQLGNQAGHAIIGAFTNIEVVSIKQDVHHARFAFEELPSEVF